MLKCYIVDDQIDAVNNLISKIKEITSDLEILGYSHSIADAYQKINQLQPDLVFLDVELGNDQTSFDLLPLFDKISFKIIFVTGHNGFAIKAIKYAALDYILKPFSSLDLIKAIDKAKQSFMYEEQIKMLQQNLNPEKKEEKIVLHSGSRVHIVNIQDITICEVVDNYVTFVLADGKKILVIKQLTEVEELLPEKIFVKVSRSQIINIKFVDFVDKTNLFIQMKDGAKISVSIRRKDFVFTKIMEYNTSKF